MNKKYNVFLLLSNMSRNIIDIFSIIILYNKGNSIHNIFIFLSIYYLFSIIVNITSIYIIIKHNYKILLFFSSIMIGVSFYILSNINNNLHNLIFLALILSLSNYTYHSVRHYLGIKYISNKKEVSISLIFIYIGTMIAGYIGAYITEKYSIHITCLIVIILSLLSIIPLFFINNKIIKDNFNFKKVKINNSLFVILEQFKVIFLLLEPLYLYIYIDNNFKYIGIFNIFIGISSIIFIYLLGKKKDTSRLFKYINFFFVIILLIKLNIKNKNILYLIGFLEGFGIKNFELSSIENFYKIDSKINIGSYLMISEIIFCLVCLLINLLFIFINNLVISMYICIIFIFICSFIRYQK